MLTPDAHGVFAGRYAPDHVCRHPILVRIVENAPQDRGIDGVFVSRLQQCAVFGERDLDAPLAVARESL